MADWTQSPAAVVVVCGETSKSIDPQLGADIVARIPNARLEVMPGVGHIPQVEAPERFNRDLAALASRVHS